MRLRAVVIRIFATAFLATSQPGWAAPTKGGAVTNYTDPVQQTSLWFGARSHWMQPWRGYLDTMPVSRLRDAIGINLNVEPDEAEAVCAHLQKHGFKLARIEFGWGNVDWNHPDQLADPARFDKMVQACKRHGIRPLFLLNGHHGAPCTLRFYDVYLTKPAKKGDSVVYLDKTNRDLIMPGRSGLNQLSDYMAAESIFTSVDAEGTAALSKPLPKDLPAGKAPAATLKYLPFYPSKIKSTGKTPPEFEETMQGWLDYVKVITNAAKKALGTENAKDAGFDLEVWNELTFGSNFLSINNYYAQPIAEGDGATAEILKRTVDWVKDPVNKLPGVGVGDGFNNQWPWGAGSIAPAGLAALDKHPYAGVKRYPADQGTPNGIRPVDAIGRPDGEKVGVDAWKDSYIPTYVSHFPEYFLNGLQTEHLVRDISPIPTDLYGVKHGRDTHPTNTDGTAAPAPKMWITEVNMDPNGADPGNLADYTRGGHTPVAPSLTAADAEHMQAKAILRYLVCGVNKGVDRYYFFAAKDENPIGLGLMRWSFYQDIKSSKGVYPVKDELLTSETMLAVRRMTGVLGVQKISKPRSLSLQKIEESHGHYQFESDPATAGQNPDPHPPLYNREVLGFFPFQDGDTRFVIGLYVMTRNMARLYKPDAAVKDVTRFDMPAESYKLTIGGVNGRTAKVSLFDPMTGVSSPVSVLSRKADSLVVSVGLTDSPRMMIVNE